MLDSKVYIANYFKGGRKMKKLVVITIVLLFNISLLSFATESIEGPFVIDEIGPCPLHGLHQMVYDNRFTVVDTPTLGNIPVYYFDCDCGEEMLTTGQPYLEGHNVGRFWYGSEFEALNGMWECGFEAFTDGTLWPSHWLDGYRFYHYDPGY